MKLFDCKKIVVTLKLDQKLQDNVQMRVMVLELTILFILVPVYYQLFLFSKREFTLVCMAQKSYLKNDKERCMILSSHTGPPFSSAKCKMQFLLIFKTCPNIRINHFGPRVYREGSYVITHVRPSVVRSSSPSLNISETALRIFLIFCMKLVHHKGTKVTEPDF